MPSFYELIKSAAKGLRLLLGLPPGDPDVAVLAYGIVSPLGTMLLSVNADGFLVNGDGALFFTGQSKAPVVAATTANITIATALNNGDTLDTSVTLATGDRVLVKNQTDATQNGIYIVGVTPVRAADFDTWQDVPGAIVGVTGGTVNAGLSFLAIAAASGAVGTDAIAFNPYPGATGFTSPIITTDIRPNGNDGATLGTSSLGFSDLFLATGATIVFGSSNVVLTHSTGVLTLGTGDLRVTTAGTNAASVVTVAGTQTLLNKIIRQPSTVYTSDGAITLTSGLHLIEKTSAAAMTVAAPSSQDGERLVIQGNTDFAHVITFTGSTLLDGTTGANLTVTLTAFKGSTIVVNARGTKWLLESSSNVTSITA